jgi:hypothetical protein
MMRQFLDVSSGHLTPETWTWLDVQFDEGALRDPGHRIAGQLGGGRTRHGWFVYAPEDPVIDIPRDLQVVLAEARRRGAEYVLLDLRRCAGPGFACPSSGIP